MILQRLGKTILHQWPLLQRLRRAVLSVSILEKSLAGQFLTRLALPLLMNPEKDRLAKALMAPKNAAVADDLAYSPLISIVMPVYNTPAHFLRAVLHSVEIQTYSRWQLCIVDDGSRDPHGREILQAAAARDPRIHLQILEKNVGIAAASQRAADAAEGEFISFVDHDDLLAPGALSNVVTALRKNSDADMVYSDHAMMREDGLLLAISAKPDWAPEFFMTTSYVVHFKAIRRSLFQKVGGFRDTIHLSQDVGLTFKLMAAGARIIHTPTIDYFWRMHRHSTATGIAGKPSIAHTALQTLDTYLTNVRAPAKAEWPQEFRLSGTSVYKLNFQNTETSAARKALVVPLPAASPTQGLEALVTSFMESLRRSCRDAELPPVHFVGLGFQPELPKLAGCFYHSAQNQEDFNARIGALDAEFLIFVSPHTLFASREWLKEIIGYFFVDAGIGAVGGKVLDLHLKVAAGGSVLVPGLPTMMLGEDDTAHGYWYTNSIASNAEAVSSQFLATRKSLYATTAGLPVFSCGDGAGVAYGVRVRQAGFRTVLNPWAKTVIREKPSPPKDLEQRVISEVGALPEDRYYSTHFDRQRIYTY